MNTFLTKEEFTKFAIEKMNESEDEFGVPRGSIIKWFIEEWNRRIKEEE